MIIGTKYNVLCMYYICLNMQVHARASEAHLLLAVGLQHKQILDIQSGKRKEARVRLHKNHI